MLTGERGHYELAAGRDTGPYLKAMEGFAFPTGLLSEQVWDEPDRPEVYMYLGRPTGSARPLMWAHAEYIKLLRSVRDGRVFDLVPEVAERYLSSGRRRKSLEIWKHNRQIESVPGGCNLRVLAGGPFLLHWTRDEWLTPVDTRSTSTSLGVGYVDIPIPAGKEGNIRFTFFWPETNRWEGRDYRVFVHSNRGYPS